VEDGAIILQGDLRRRLEAWLTARGVRKVTVA
ncbi:MAG: translation initiation factor, partial [Kofleriaceae bacterium]